jgi:translation initiation factor 1
MKHFGDLDIVYSTDSGRVKPAQPKSPMPNGDGIVRVGRSTKGRKGAGVTTVSGVPLHPDGLKQLAKELKQCCGTGGTVKEGVIEIQGEHREQLVGELERRGYRVKRAGG